MREDLKEKFGALIVDTHEVHVWCIVPNKIVATLHVIFKDEDSYMASRQGIRDFLVSTYGIDQVTMQPEFVNNKLNGVRNGNARGVVKEPSLDSWDSDGSSSAGTSSSPCTTGGGGGGTEDTREEQSLEVDPSGNNGDVVLDGSDVGIGNTCLLKCPDESCLTKRCCKNYLNVALKQNKL